MMRTEPRIDPLTTPASSGGEGNTATRQPAKRRGLSGLVTRFWLILTVLAVVALSGFVVHRLHDVFGVRLPHWRESLTRTVDTIFATAPT